jgi:hypothetical protein
MLGFLQLSSTPFDHRCYDTKIKEKNENIFADILFFITGKIFFILHQPLLEMGISPEQKICIEKILSESLTTWDDLFEKYNFFASNETSNRNGDIGWAILSGIAEKNKKYRRFVQGFPEHVDVEREAGNYVHEVIMRKIEEHSV